MASNLSLFPESSDEESRRRIETDLDRNFLVQAAAGTGKTTSLVARVVATLREGRAEVTDLAVVTFTLKAAAQIRERVSAALDRGIAEATSPAKKRCLSRAREGIDSAFLGTIHAFCSRLLRERPVEAGIDPEFREADEDQDDLVRTRIWRSHLERLPYQSPDLLQRLDDVGVRVRDLEHAYEVIAEHPDVRVVHEPAPLPNFHTAVRETERFLDELVPALRNLDFRREPDEFVPAAFRAWHYRRNANLSKPTSAAEFLEIVANCKITQKRWPNASLAKASSDRLRELQSDLIEPTLVGWYTHRHDAATAAILPALAEFQAERRRSGRPSFTDLLLLSRDMLRDSQPARKYFQKRFPRLLVDEFQDTDPVQAEVMLYLAGDRPAEEGWKSQKPRPGSLFVVGDPKQSIYRFRRADIETYREVKDIIEESGGAVLTLSRTFRCAPAVAGWVNGVFGEIFDGSVPHQAENVPIESVRKADGPLTGVFDLVTTCDGKKQEIVVEEDSRAVAAWIAALLSGSTSISVREGERETERPAGPGDFLVILRETKHLDAYARALESEGIPAQVTGGKAFGDSEEVKALLAILEAVLDPDDPVSLVAFLRGPFCGVDDDSLYRFKRDGGKFQLFGEIPAGADDRIVRGYRQLREARKLTRSLPPAAAIARIADIFAIFAGGFSDEGGARRAGNLAKTLLTARELSRQGASLPEIAAALADLVERSKAGEMDIEPVKPDAVRVMNLHQAKGLEAPFVILANPADPFGHGGPEYSIQRGSDPPDGYFLIRRAGLERTGREIARPADWADFKTREKEYKEAEESRLLYVAATRAMNTLVITGYVDGSASKPKASYGAWKDLVRGPLPRVPEFTRRVRQPASGLPRDLAAEFAKAAAEIAATRSGMALPTFASIAPSQLETGTVLREHTGKGMSWGRAVHRALESLMRNDCSGDSLVRLAENLLRDEDRPPEDLPDLLRLLESVRASDIWSRARRAGERYVEVPFAAWVKSSENGLPDPPERTLINGAIDLVFKEEGVWKLIDYKTDRISDSIDALSLFYRSQLVAYRDQWKRVTGEPTDAGLCFLERPTEVEWLL